MAPPIEPLACSAYGCGYSTLEGAQDFTAQLTCLSLNTQQAHPVQVPGNIAEGPVACPTCKVDKRARPIVALVTCPSTGTKQSLRDLIDVRLRVIERVPVNTPVKWQSQMVVIAKTNGDPCRTVDF